MCVLHNYLRDASDQTYCPPGYVDVVQSDGEVTDGFWRQATCPLQGLDVHNRSMNGAAFEIRERLCDYFIGPGQVGWQDIHINRR